MKLFVVLENGRRRERFAVDSLEGVDALVSIRPRLLAWLSSLAEHTRVSGICRSFTVSAHVLTADCDHETGEADR
jgi:hypothetical protein